MGWRSACLPFCARASVLEEKDILEISHWMLHPTGVASDWLARNWSVNTKQITAIT
jgi:hypothetical protein